MAPFYSATKSPVFRMRRRSRGADRFTSSYFVLAGPFLCSLVLDLVCKAYSLPKPRHRSTQFPDVSSLERTCLRSSTLLLPLRRGFRFFCERVRTGLFLCSFFFSRPTAVSLNASLLVRFRRIFPIEIFIIWQSEKNENNIWHLYVVPFYYLIVA